MVWMKQCRPANLSIVLGLAFVLVLVYYTLYTERNASRIERVSLRLLLRTSILAAIRGGNEVTRARQESMMRTWSKGKNQFGQDDPLTDGDLRSHRVILRTLLETFPRLNVISEERDSSKSVAGAGAAAPATGAPAPAGGGGAASAAAAAAAVAASAGGATTVAPPLEEVNLPESISGYVDEKVRMTDVVVWVDPLDATQEYTEGLTSYVTTMVCIAVKGQARIGVIHQPFANRTVWAWVGQGPSKSLSSPDPAAGAAEQPDIPTVAKDIIYGQDPDADAATLRFIVSRSHAGTVEQFIKQTITGNIRVTAAGGAGYKALQVAEGREHLYLHTTLIKKWDICAGAALLETLGGQMLTLQGDVIDFGPREEANRDGVLAYLNDKSEWSLLTAASLPN